MGDGGGRVPVVLVGVDLDVQRQTLRRRVDMTSTGECRTDDVRRVSVELLTSVGGVWN